MTKIFRPDLVSSNSVLFLPQHKLCLCVCVCVCVFLRISVRKKWFTFVSLILAFQKIILFTVLNKWNGWMTFEQLKCYCNLLMIKLKLGRESPSSIQHSSSFSKNKSNNSWVFLKLRAQKSQEEGRTFFQERDNKSQQANTPSTSREKNG